VSSPGDSSCAGGTPRMPVGAERAVCACGA
jgi:hypothetical protein